MTQNFWSTQRLLVIAPHPDDEAYGCAGTIAKVKDAGGEVYVMIGSAATLRHYSAAHGEVTGARRGDELAAAMRLLRVDGFEVLYADESAHLRLDTKPQRELIGLIEREARYAIDEIRPTMLILPHPSYNQDHEALFRAGFAACRPHLPSDKPFVQFVLTCDAPQLAWNHHSFRPNFYVDITDQLAAKLGALACHASQLRPAPHHGSLEMVEHRARARGAEISVGAAEVYECQRFTL
jgi:LmbE family N-acetylglucosaminyl deacetylase